MHLDSVPKAIAGAVPGDANNRLDTLRITGQAYLRQNSPKAESAFLEMLEILRDKSGDAMPPSKRAFLTNWTFSNLGAYYQRNRMYEKSVEAFSQVLSDESSSIRFRQSAYLGNARNWLELGQNTRAVSAYDGLLKEFPDYGQDTGSVVSVKLNRVEAMGLQNTNQKKMDLIREIWNDPKNDAYPQKYNVGRYLVELYLENGNDVDASEVGQDLMADMDEVIGTASHDDIEQYGLADVYAQTALNLGIICQRHSDDIQALTWYSRLLRRFPDHPLGRSASEQIAKIEKAIGIDYDKLPDIDGGSSAMRLQQTSYPTSRASQVVLPSQTTMPVQLREGQPDAPVASDRNRVGVFLLMVLAIGAIVYMLWMRRR
jgi:tetratricopeptide (TPR) repeat protein